MPEPLIHVPHPRLVDAFEISEGRVVMLYRISDLAERRETGYLIRDNVKIPDVFVGAYMASVFEDEPYRPPPFELC